LQPINKAAVAANAPVAEIQEKEALIKKRQTMQTLLSSQALIFSPISFNIMAPCQEALGLSKIEAEKINKHLHRYVANIALREKSLAKQVETKEGPCLRIEPHKELDVYRERFAQDCDEIFKDSSASNTFANAVAGSHILGTLGAHAEEFFVRDEVVNGKKVTYMVTRRETNGEMIDRRKEIYNEGDFSRAAVILGNANAIAGLDKEYLDPDVAEKLLQKMRDRKAALQK
jgi:hypothetical protein